MLTNAGSNQSLPVGKWYLFHKTNLVGYDSFMIIIDHCITLRLINIKLKKTDEYDFNREGATACLPQSARCTFVGQTGHLALHSELVAGNFSRHIFRMKAVWKKKSSPENWRFDWRKPNTIGWKRRALQQLARDRVVMQGACWWVNQLWSDIGTVRWMHSWKKSFYLNKSSIVSDKILTKRWRNYIHCNWYQSSAAGCSSIVMG